MTHCCRVDCGTWVWDLSLLQRADVCSVSDNTLDEESSLLTAGYARIWTTGAFTYCTIYILSASGRIKLARGL